MRKLLVALALALAGLTFGASSAHAQPAPQYAPTGCSTWTASSGNGVRGYGSCGSAQSGHQMRVVASCSFYNVTSSWVFVGGFATVVATSTCWFALSNVHIELR